MRVFVQTTRERKISPAPPGSVTTSEHNYLKHEDFELVERPAVFKVKNYSSKISSDFIPNRSVCGSEGLQRL